MRASYAYVLGLRHGEWRASFFEPAGAGIHFSYIFFMSIMSITIHEVIQMGHSGLWFGSWFVGVCWMAIKGKHLLCTYDSTFKLGIVP